MSFIRDMILWIGVMEIFIIFYVLMNIIAFSLYAIDKRRAEKNLWRISENTLIFFTLACGAIGALIGMRVFRHKTQKLKFKIAVIIGLVIAIIPVIHIVHGATIDRVAHIVEHEFRSENWPPELDGYRIAFMADFHIIEDETMQDIVTELNERNIDLLLLGGDFSMRDSHYQGTLREISRTSTTDGIFGVEGNHDCYIRLFAAKEYYGITPLDNSGVRIREGFYLAGVQDLWNREPNIAGATAGSYQGDFVLLVTHNPDVSMEQSTMGVNLIFAGHTHGGQMTFFGFPFILWLGNITRYGTRFARGFNYSADGVPVFTSVGVGHDHGVQRIFSRLEVVVFTLYSK